MFSFTHHNKRLEVRKYLARICDLTTPNYAAPAGEGWHVEKLGL